MDEVIVEEFNGYKVEMRKLRLRDANLLLPFVFSIMTKIGLGNMDFFGDLSGDNIDLIQKKMCEYSYKLCEEQRSDGNLDIVKKNLTLSDLDDSVYEVSNMMFAFMDFNFRFFSQAPKMFKKAMG